MSGNYFSTRAGKIYWVAPELLAPSGSKYSQPDPVELEQPAEPKPSTPDGFIAFRPPQKSDVYSFSGVCIEVRTFPVHPLSFE